MPFLTSLMYFVIMILIIFAAYLTSRWFAMKTNNLAQGKYIKVLDRVVLGKDKSIMIIEIGQKVYLLSDNSQGVSCISPLEESDLIPLKQDANNSFGDILSKYLGTQTTDKGISFEEVQNNLKDLKIKMTQSLKKMVDKHRGNGDSDDKK